MTWSSKRNPEYAMLVDGEGNPIGTAGNPIHTSGGTPADGSITTDMIQDGAVTDTKLAKPKADLPQPLTAQTVLGTNFSGEYGLVGYSQNPMADQLAMYQFGGQLATADPQADGDAATKKYVDDNLPRQMTQQEAQEGTLTVGRTISPQTFRSLMPSLSSVAMLDPGATLEDVVNKVNEIIQTISP